MTTVLEHNSVLRPLYEMEKRGAVLTIVGCEKDSSNGTSRKGRLDMIAMEKAITPGTKAVVMTHAPISPETARIWLRWENGAAGQALFLL